jgi:uncharacterized protein YjbJ (UPF0337 family)
MDKDRIEGKLEDVKGRVKRQAGEWTGDKELQGEGAMDQAKGKAKDAFGKVKDAGRDAIDRMKDKADRDDVDRKDEEDVA